MATYDVSYNKFTQRFIVVMDNFNGLRQEVMALLSEGLSMNTIDENLKSELELYASQVNLMEELGMKRYGRTKTQMYNDGWKFWIEEDKQLREKRYGSKK